MIFRGPRLFLYHCKNAMGPGILFSKVRIFSLRGFFNPGFTVDCHFSLRLSPLEVGVLGERQRDFDLQPALRAIAKPVISTNFTW